MGAYDDLFADGEVNKKKGTYDDLFTEEPKSTGFKQKSLAELLSNYGDANTLNQGAKVVSGLPGVLEVGARRGYAGIGKVEQGALSILGDMLNSETLRNASDAVGNRARQIENSAVLRGQRSTGFAPESIVNDIPEAGANAVSSVIQTAPALLAGTLAPGAALPVLFGQTFGQEYAQGKDAGLTPLKATGRAIPMAAFEVAGEKLGGFDQLAEGLRAATRGNGVADLGSAMVASAIKEIPSEEFTTTGQFLTDKAPVIGLNQDATLADYGQQVKDTALATALQSGAMGGAGRIIQGRTLQAPSLMENIQPAPQDAQPAQAQVNAPAVVDAINQAVSNVKPSAIDFLEADTTEAPNVSQPTQQPVTGLDPATAGPELNNGIGSPAIELAQPNADAGGDSAVPNGAMPASDIPDAIAPVQQPADLTQETNKQSLSVEPPAQEPKKRASKPKANTLLAAIDSLGGIDNKYKWDISGEQRFARGGYNRIFKNASTKTLEQHIENGDLDEFLPYDMRSTVTDDPTAGRDYLADRIRNGDPVLPYDVELEAKQSRVYEADPLQTDIQNAVNEDAFDLDTVNALLSEAGYEEREQQTESRYNQTEPADSSNAGQIENTQPESTASSVVGDPRREVGQATGSQPAAQNEVTGTLGSNEREGTRQQVETIVKRRAAANQLGKLKPFDTALKLAKDFMNGENVAPNKFKNAATMFANDKPLSEAFTALAEMAKAPARENRQSARSAMDVFTEQINNAKTVDELKSISRNIQMETGVVSDAMAQQLDDLVMARIDALDNGTDQQPESTSPSWVIRNKQTGEVIQETFQKSVADKVNKDKYEAVPILQHLQEMNDPESKVRKFAQDDVEGDLLGDNTAQQQAVADAERAKDDKRNSGDSNSTDFVLTGSTRPADEAAARGAQDMFGGNNATVTMAAQGSEQSTEPTQEAAAAVEEVAQSETSPLSMYDNIMEEYRNGNATVDKYKAAFDYVLNNEQAITEYLEANFTKQQLFDRGVSDRYKGEKKDRVVSAAYSDMVRDFLLPNENGMVTSQYGFGGDKYADIKRQVSEITQESLNAAMQRRQSAIKANAERRAERIKGMADPKTLDDYQAFMREKTSEGMLFQDARMTLTPAQREQYDDLVASYNREQRRVAKNSQKTQVEAAVTTTSGDIVETQHTRTGEPLFVVKAAERVERDTYNLWNTTAKRMGGYYSSFRGNGAVPGFQFKTRENAEAFLQYLGGDVDQAKEAIQSKRDAYADDRSQTAVERLNEMSDKLEADANEDMSRDRKVNTARRAGMAARAEARASENKAMAVTMRNIAGAIESGNAKYLDAVRQKVQVELLQSAVSVAQQKRLREMYPSYADYEKRRYDPPTGETADYADFPAYALNRSDWARLGRAMLNVNGLKAIGTKILSVADDVTDTYLKFAKENIDKVSNFSRSDGSRAAFKSKADAEMAIAKNGFNGKAIVLPYKRGENIIIDSPAAAKEKGVWPGDDDKRISLNSDFGKEVVEKIGRANRRANKLDMPWQLESVYDKRQKLARMDIETPAEYRAALREFIALKETAAAPDKVKELERSMVGRRNDGLDFFPTPAEVADTLIDVADIQDGMNVLEPSAGMGHIAERIRNAGFEPDVIEFNGDRRELLELKGFNVVGSDFIEQSESYDRIIMNPPFSNRRDEQHVRHAYNLLKPGGRIVAIMGEGVFIGSDKRATEFRDWLESVGGTSEKLPDGTFNDASLPVNTNANARMVVINKVDGGGDPSFKRDSMTDAIAGIGRQQAQAVDRVQSQIDTITKGWKNAPTIQVVYDMTDESIPEAVRNENERQLSQGATGQPQGFIIRGKVFIVASEMNSMDDVTRVLFHESLGHYGLRGMYDKPALVAALNRVATMRASDVAKKAKQYGLDIKNERDRLIAAEEVLAELAETRPEIGVVKQVIATIRAWLRENVPYFKNLELSDAEIIRDYILPARRYVEAGGKEQTAGDVVAAFQRETPQTETDAFKKWFGDSKVVDANGNPLVVYHGTRRKFDAFEPMQPIAAPGNPKAIYFTSDKSEAKEYAADTYGDMDERSRLVPVYLKIENDSDGIIKKRNVRGEDVFEYAVFKPGNIKSATDNNGNFDPTDSRIAFQRSKEAEPKRSMVRDELGRFKSPTGIIYDKTADIVQTLAQKVAFGQAPKELRTMTRLYKADIQKAMDAASNVVKTMAPMSQLDRALVSDVVEKMVATGVTPPESIVKIATGMQNAMDIQTDELVSLGMLSQYSSDRWRGKYLPRFYMRENTEGVKAWVGKMLRNSLPVRGIGGNSLKGRGLFEEINVNEVPKYEALGWEVRDPLWKKNRQGELELIDANKVVTPEKVVVWRDWTPSERAEMGENRDALFRFVMGYTSMQNDIALGRLFDSIAKNQEWTRARASEGYVKVPDSEIPETGGVKRYGNLAGLYVKKEILDHISQYEEASELWKYYRKALSFWKAGKTVLNPVAHVNNVVSNLTMAHFAGVSYWDAHKYIGAIKDFVKDAPMIQEAKDRGLMTGDITRAELMSDMPDDIKAMMEMQESAIKRKSATVFNIITFGLSKPMGKAYRFEDDFFKYLIYRDARKNGLSPDDAVDYATKYIFTYDDLPKGARTVRDLAIPFFAYTYKAVPALTHTLFNYPWRFVAPAAAVWGVNAIAFALAAGDDDDDWQTMYEKGKELEAEERKNLPPWMQGRSALGASKSIRLGTDEKTQLPIYMDVSRMIPGGDVFDVTNQADGVPVPAPIMPSNPVLTTIAAMFWNKDTFTGKEVVDLNDTGKEAAQKRAEWLLRQLSPAVAPTAYHFDRLAEATALMSEKTVETPWKDYTGYGKDGLPVQGKYAIPQTFGIKARPIDLEKSAEIAQGQDNKEIRSIMAEIRQAARLLDQNAISQREYDRRVSDAEAKIEAIESK